MLHHPKILLRFLAGTMMLSAVGCMVLPPIGFKKQQQQFVAIEPHMTKDQVYDRLGPPDLLEENGRQHWILERGRYEARLILWFDSKGRMGELSRHTTEF